jgi:hypothetical protein
MRRIFCFAVGLSAAPAETEPSAQVEIAAARRRQRVMIKLLINPVFPMGFIHGSGEGVRTIRGLVIEGERKT